jgi:hypothetical protein
MLSKCDGRDAEVAPPGERAPAVEPRSPVR